jgi:iron complex outermembrane receptor protein
MGSCALLNFQAEYAFNDMTSMTIGGINLLDENYFLAEGFPEPGRQFFANLSPFLIASPSAGQLLA